MLQKSIKLWTYPSSWQDPCGVWVSRVAQTNRQTSYYFVNAKLGLTLPPGLLNLPGPLWGVGVSGSSNRGSTPRFKGGGILKFTFLRGVSVLKLQIINLYHNKNILFYINLWQNIKTYKIDFYLNIQYFSFVSTQFGSVIPREGVGDIKLFITLVPKVL